MIPVLDLCCEYNSIILLPLPITLILIAFFCGNHSLTGILHLRSSLKWIVLVRNFPLSRSFLCFRQRIPSSLEAVRQWFMNYSRNGRIIHEDDCTNGLRHLIVSNQKRQIHNLRDLRSSSQLVCILIVINKSDNF